MLEPLIDKFFPELILEDNIHLCKHPGISVCRPSNGPLEGLVIVMKNTPGIDKTATCLISGRCAICSIVPTEPWDPTLTMNSKHFEDRGCVNDIYSNDIIVFGGITNSLIPTAFYLGGYWKEWHADSLIKRFYSCVIEKR